LVAFWSASRSKTLPLKISTNESSSVGGSSISEDSSTSRSYIAARICACTQSDAPARKWEGAHGDGGREATVRAAKI
jgi:hypothetical protein